MATLPEYIRNTCDALIAKIDDGKWRPYPVNSQDKPEDKGCGCILQLMYDETHTVAPQTQNAFYRAMRLALAEYKGVTDQPQTMSLIFFNDHEAKKETVRRVVEICKERASG